MIKKEGKILLEIIVHWILFILFVYFLWESPNKIIVFRNPKSETFVFFITTIFVLINLIINVSRKIQEIKKSIIYIIITCILIIHLLIAIAFSLGFLLIVILVENSFYESSILIIGLFILVLLFLYNRFFSKKEFILLRKRIKLFLFLTLLIAIIDFYPLIEQKILMKRLKYSKLTIAWQEYDEAKVFHLENNNFEIFNEIERIRDEKELRIANINSTYSVFDYNNKEIYVSDNYIKSAWEINNNKFLILQENKSEESSRLFWYNPVAKTESTIDLNVQSFNGININSHGDVLYASNEGIKMINTLGVSRIVCKTGKFSVWANNNSLYFYEDDVNNGIYYYSLKTKEKVEIYKITNNDKIYSNLALSKDKNFIAFFMGSILVDSTDDNTAKIDLKLIIYDLHKKKAYKLDHILKDYLTDGVNFQKYTDLYCM